MTSPAPGPQPSEKDKWRAQRAARFAARRNLPATACPYHPYSDDPAVRVLARTWIAEYLRHNPAPAGVIDYDT